MCLNAGGMGRQDAETETLIPTTGGVFDVAHTLKADGFDVSEDGTGRGTPIVPIPFAFSSKDYGNDVQENLSPTLRSMGHDGSHANGGGQVAIAIQERAVSENPDAGPDGVGVRDDGAAYTLEARAVTQAVAFAQNTRDEVRHFGGDGSIAGALAAEPGMKQTTYVAEPFVMMERGREGGSNLEYRQDGTANANLTPNGGRNGFGVGAIAQEWAVRRLTPTECERLQGFPDGHTAITHRGKPAADGPRYKACGNSMAVNCMRWLGERIEYVERAVAGSEA